MSDYPTDKYVNAVGRFLCKIKQPGNGWLDETKSGTPFVRIPCIVTEPGSDQDGKEIVWRGYLSPRAKENTQNALERALDFDGNWEDMDYFAGHDVIIVTDEEEYEGVKRIKAKWLNNVTNKVAAEKAAEIAARLNKESGVAPAKASKPKPAQETQDVEDDDIPF